MSDTTTVNDDDLATLLAKREHARPNRLTWVLLTLIVLTVGFVAGAVVNQKLGSSSSSGTFSGPPAGFTPPGSGASSTVTADAVSGGFGGMTIGTVKLVDGTNVYVTTTDGATVKVKVPAAASVTAQKDVTLADLANGTTVMVRGETAADGTVTASSVSEATLPDAAPAQQSTQATTPPTTQGAN